jgi:hypothetical protein
VGFLLLFFRSGHRVGLTMPETGSFHPPLLDFVAMRLELVFCLYKNTLPCTWQALRGPGALKRLSFAFL